MSNEDRLAAAWNAVINLATDPASSRVKIRTNLKVISDLCEELHVATELTGQQIAVAMALSEQGR